MSTQKVYYIVRWHFLFDGAEHHNEKIFTDWHTAAECSDDITKAATILGFGNELVRIGIDTEVD